MQINPRTISRLVRLGTRAFRAFRSSQTRGQSAPSGQHRPSGAPGRSAGTAGQQPRTGHDGGTGGG